MGTFEGRVALVTGGASGIGLATAQILAAEGAAVSIADVDMVGAERGVASILAKGGKAVAIPLDVTCEEAWERAIEQVERDLGPLSIAVNNAGLAAGGTLELLSLDEWRSVLAVNLDGVFLGVKHAIRAMRRGERGGSIVNVASAAGVKAIAGAGAYGVSKAGVLHLTKVAALECAQRKDGIRVNAIVPGGVRTPIWTKTSFWEGLVKARGEEGAWEELSRDTPLGRFAEPEEVACAIRFLVSDEAAYITGAGLMLDGGYVL